MTKEIIQHQNEDWFDGMLEEIKALLVEKRFEMEETLIRTKHEVGALICANEDKANVAELVLIVAERANVSERTIQQCVQFYKFDPELTVLDGGKNISWRKCLRRMQNKKPPKEECGHLQTKTILVCVTCGDKVEHHD